jgi:hypothetical protein
MEIILEPDTVFCTTSRLHSAEFPYGLSGAREHSRQKGRVLGKREEAKFDILG